MGRILTALLACVIAMSAQAKEQTNALQSGKLLHAACLSIQRTVSGDTRVSEREHLRGHQCIGALSALDRAVGFAGELKSADGQYRLCKPRAGSNVSDAMYALIQAGDLHPELLTDESDSADFLLFYAYSKISSCPFSTKQP